MNHQIVIICLPSHTTHVLQPCDVGVFGPLAQAWKSVVTKASQDLTVITKDNILGFYHTARSTALKERTIVSAFRRTGIYPLNRDIIPLLAYEPAKNTTTQAAQPLPAHLPSVLTPVPSPMPTPNPTPHPTPMATPTPTPNPTPATTPATSLASTSALRDDNVDTTPGQTRTASTASTSALQYDSADNTPISLNTNPEDDTPVQRYHIEVPPPLCHTASRSDLYAENKILREIIKKAGFALEHDYAQMKLMDLENERLRKRAFARDQQKLKKHYTTNHARHMTAEENLELLAREEWERKMKVVYKQLSPRFKRIKKDLATIERNKEKVRKAAQGAPRGHGRGRGSRAGAAAAVGGGRGGGGRGRGRSNVIEPEPEPESDSSAYLSDNDKVVAPRRTRATTRIIRPTLRAQQAAENNNLDTDDEKSGFDGGNGSVGTGRSARPKSVNKTSSGTDSSEDSSPEEPEAPPEQPRPLPPLPKSRPKPRPAYRGAKNVVSPPNDTALDDLPEIRVEMIPEAAGAVIADAPGPAGPSNLPNLGNVAEGTRRLLRSNSKQNS